MITFPVSTVPVPEPALTGAAAAAAAPLAALAEPLDPDDVLPPEPAVPPVPDTPATAVDPMWVRNDSSMTSPAMVPPRASTTRRIGFLRLACADQVRLGCGCAAKSGRAQNSKDSWWICLRGTPTAVSAAMAESVMPAGPQTYTS